MRTSSSHESKKTSSSELRGDLRRALVLQYLQFEVTHEAVEEGGGRGPPLSQKQIVNARHMLKILEPQNIKILTIMVYAAILAHPGSG